MSGINTDAHLLSYVGVWNRQFALRITIVYAVFGAVFDVTIRRLACGAVICVFTAGLAVPIAFTATLSALRMKTVIEFHACAPVIHYYATEWEYHTWLFCDFRFCRFLFSAALRALTLLRRF